MKTFNKVIQRCLLTVQPLIFVILWYLIKTKDYINVLGNTHGVGDYLIRWFPLLILLGIGPFFSFVFSLYVKGREGRREKGLLIVSVVEMIFILPFIIAIWFIYVGEHGIGF